MVRCMKHPTSVKSAGNPPGDFWVYEVWLIAVFLNSILIKCSMFSVGRISQHGRYLTSDQLYLYISPASRGLYFVCLHAYLKMAKQIKYIPFAVIFCFGTPRTLSNIDMYSKEASGWVWVYQLSNGPAQLLSLRRVLCSAAKCLRLPNRIPCSLPLIAVLPHVSLGGLQTQCDSLGWPFSAGICWNRVGRGYGGKASRGDVVVPGRPWYWENRWSAFPIR